MVDQKGVEVDDLLAGLFAALVLAGVAAFGYLSVNIAGVQFSEGGYYEVLAEFDNVSGLKEGAPVEIAGVEVGQISNISLKGTIANVTFRILEGVIIRDDDIAAVRTKGIIGDRYVKIIPGGSDVHLNGGDELFQTESAIELEEVLGKIIHRVE